MAVTMTAIDRTMIKVFSNSKAPGDGNLSVVTCVLPTGGVMKHTTFWRVSRAQMVDRTWFWSQKVTETSVQANIGVLSQGLGFTGIPVCSATKTLEKSSCQSIPSITSIARVWRPFIAGYVAWQCAGGVGLVTTWVVFSVSPATSISTCSWVGLTKSQIVYGIDQYIHVGSTVHGAAWYVDYSSWGLTCSYGHHRRAGLISPMVATWRYEVDTDTITICIGVTGRLNRNWYGVCICEEIV